MAIIVEDGSNVPGANSYVSLAGARAILGDYGQDLDFNDELAEIQLLKAAKYIDSWRNLFLGNKVAQSQLMQWPRDNVYIDSWLFSNTSIPQELINAQVFAAYEEAQGNTLQGTYDNRSTSSEEVTGAVKVSYFETGSLDGKKIMDRVSDELAVLIRDTRTVRGERG